MKPKDIGALVIAVVIFLVAGYLAYTQLVPKTASQGEGVKVEVVGVIASEFDSAALETLADSSKVRDYSVLIDLTTGLNNQAVFGQ